MGYHFSLGLFNCFSNLSLVLLVSVQVQLFYITFAGESCKNSYLPQIGHNDELKKLFYLNASWLSVDFNVNSQ